MKGCDVLGLGSDYWNMKALLRALPDQCALGCFGKSPGTFKDPIKHLRRCLQTGKVALVRVQLYYTKAHGLVPMKFLKEQLPRWEALAIEFPNVKFYLSHTTEHREWNKQKLLERMLLIQTDAHHCIPVNNPDFGKGAQLPGFIDETHGPKPLNGTYFYSMDGLDPGAKTNLYAIMKAHAGAAQVFAWGGLCNLNDGKQPADPNKRKAAPGKKYLSMLFDMSDAIPEPPVPTFKAKEIAKPLLWKPFSQGTGDAREGKPAFIGESPAQYLKIVTCQGKSIGRLIKPPGDLGTYLGGLFRHYSGMGGCNLWGYEMSRKAKAASGSPYVYLTDGTHHWGWILPAFRRGFYE